MRSLNRNTLDYFTFQQQMYLQSFLQCQKECKKVVNHCKLKFTIKFQF